MKYHVKYYNKWQQPYFYTESKEICETENYDSYTTTSFELCKQIVKDFLDAPTAELSLEAIHQDFDHGNDILAESQAICIQTYYNGRLAMYNAILTDLNEVKGNKTLHYDIPEKYNRFTRYENDEDEKLSKQLEAYIEIEVKNDN